MDLLRLPKKPGAIWDLYMRLIEKTMLSLLLRHFILQHKYFYYVKYLVETGEKILMIEIQCFPNDFFTFFVFCSIASSKTVENFENQS